MIEFRQVTKVFPNGYVGLQDVSFALQPGELVYIVGESGAGKTTLMRLLIRELEPTEGEIFFAGESIHEMPRNKIPHLRRQIGVVFQDYKLLPERTINENIDLVLEIMGVPNKERVTRIAEVLELVGLADKGQLFPVQLSGGELQRVSLARALSSTPSAIFADEPSGNLDPETSKGIAELLKKIAELGTTVIVSTHDETLLHHAPSREIHMHQGRVVSDTGSPASAKKAETPAEDEDHKEKAVPAKKKRRKTESAEEAA